MPVTVRVNITGDTKLLGAQLEQYKDKAADLMRLAATVLRRKLATEPSPQHIPWNPVGGAPPAYKSERQRLFVILSVKEGLMDAPYQRTQKLSQAWTVDEKKEPTRIIETIGNDTPKFSEYIYDRDKQVYRAKEVKWPTVQSVAENDWPPIAADIKRDLDGFKPTT